MMEFFIVLFTTAGDLSIVDPTFTSFQACMEELYRLATFDPDSYIGAMCVNAELLDAMNITRGG